LQKLNASSIKIDLPDVSGSWKRYAITALHGKGCAMKFLFWLLAIFAAAVALALTAKNPGYVLLVYPPYRIELSLTLFALACWRCSYSPIFLRVSLSLCCACPTRYALTVNSVH